MYCVVQRSHRRRDRATGRPAGWDALLMGHSATRRRLTLSSSVRRVPSSASAHRATQLSQQTLRVRHPFCTRHATRIPLAIRSGARASTSASADRALPVLAVRLLRTPKLKKSDNGMGGSCCRMREDITRPFRFRYGCCHASLLHCFERGLPLRSR